MKLLRKSLNFLLLLRPYTFSRSQKAGSHYYEIVQKADLHYYLIVVPFMLALIIGLPLWLIPLGSGVLFDSDRTLLDRAIMGGITALGLAPLFCAYVMLKIFDIEGGRKGSLLDKELDLTTIFTIGHGQIDLKNTPDASVLAIQDITNITIRNQNLIEHHQFNGKKYSLGPPRRRMSIREFNLSFASRPFDYIFQPSTFSVDVETADKVLTLTRNLRHNRAHKLVKSIARDMRLKLHPLPRDLLRYEASFDIVRTAL